MFVPAGRSNSDHGRTPPSDFDLRPPISPEEQRRALQLEQRSKKVTRRKISKGAKSADLQSSRPWKSNWSSTSRPRRLAIKRHGQTETAAHRMAPSPHMLLVPQTRFPPRNAAAATNIWIADRYLFRRQGDQSWTSATRRRVHDRSCEDAVGNPSRR